MTVAAWLESGIYLKMEKEITTSRHFRDLFEFWTKGNEQENKPLTLQHVLTSFLVLGFGLTLSSTIFILELWPGLNKRLIWGKPITKKLSAGKGLGTVTRLGKTTLEENNTTKSKKSLDVVSTCRRKGKIFPILE